MEIKVVPHDPAWARKFESEAALWAQILGSALVGVHHIGSTAVPGICAKPIVDLLVEVQAIESADGCAPRAAVEGYEAMGEFGISGRRYFRKDDSLGVRQFQVHVFPSGSAHAERHLAFRDYLRSHPAIALEYSLLKRSLANQYPSDIEAYMDGKDRFIKLHERRALAWRRSA